MDILTIFAVSNPIYEMLPLQTGPGIPADLLAQMRKVPRIPSPSVLMGPPNPPESRWDAALVALYLPLVVGILREVIKKKL